MSIETARVLSRHNVFEFLLGTRAKSVDSYSGGTPCVPPNKNPAPDGAGPSFAALVVSAVNFRADSPAAQTGILWSAVLGVRKVPAHQILRHEVADRLARLKLASHLWLLSCQAWVIWLG